MQKKGVDYDGVFVDVDGDDNEDFVLPSEIAPFQPPPGVPMSESYMDVLSCSAVVSVRDRQQGADLAVVSVAGGVLNEQPLISNSRPNSVSIAAAESEMAAVAAVGPAAVGVAASSKSVRRYAGSRTTPAMEEPGEMGSSGSGKSKPKSGRSSPSRSPSRSRATTT